MAIPGNMATHNSDFPAPAKDNNFPQVKVSGGMPNPKNDKNDSIKIAAAIPNAIVIKTGPIAFGMACLNKILHFEKPNASAASTYSKLLTFNSSALINLAISVQDVKPITTIIRKILGSAIATIPIIKNNLGIETRTSINLCTKISIGIAIFCLKYPIGFKIKLLKYANTIDIIIIKMPKNNFLKVNA